MKVLNYLITALKLIFYSSELQDIDRAAKIAPEKRLGTHFGRLVGLAGLGGGQGGAPISP